MLLPDAPPDAGLAAETQGGSSPSTSRGCCRGCREHWPKACGLLALTAADLAAAALLAGAGELDELVLWAVRFALLAAGFVLAVRLGGGSLGSWPAPWRRRSPARAQAQELRLPLAARDCLPAGAEAARGLPAAAPGGAGAAGASFESEGGSGSFRLQVEAELARFRESADAAKHQSGKKNVVLSLLFLVVTAQSMYTGIQVLVRHDLSHLAGGCLTLAVFCMNLEFVLLKGLVGDITKQEGVMLHGVHEHKLYYQPKAVIATCRQCRQRLGALTGGSEGFQCKDCANDRGQGFWVCLLCYRKQMSKSNTAEGILRGDKGPKVIQELTTWQYLLRAARLCRPFRCTLATAISCTFLTQVARVAMPNYQGEIFNALIASDRPLFARLLATFVSLSVVAMVFGSVQSLAVEIVQRRITCDMRTAMFESLVRQDIAFYDGLMTGQVTSRMTNDVSAVVQPVRQLMVTVLTNSLRLGGGLFMCLLTSWKLTVLACTMIGPVIYLTRIYAIWSKKLNMRIRVNMADANAVATEALKNIRTVRSFSADELEVRTFRGHINDALRYGMKDAYASAGVSAITQYLEFSATILILWYGGAAVLSTLDGRPPELSIGQLITFNLYWNMLNNSITGLNGVLNTLIRAASAAQRVFEIIDLEPDIPLDGGELHLEADAPCSVEFQNLCFTYQMRPEKQVLRGLSFAIPAGSTVAVVGRSGAGKSTLVSLLLRFYDPQGGAVLLNGRPLPSYNLRSFQRRVGVVSQETQVFCRPIRENLTYGLPDDSVTDEQVVAAAKTANADEFIADFDEGYRAMIGEGGVRLSGGQKQRLAIARALLRRPSLLLLDEATSALDAENEGKVQQSLDELMASMAGRCSVMLIAHRLSTVMGADKIVVVDGGQVVEQGSHAELLESGQIYAQLVQRQLAKQANTISEDAPRAGDPAEEPASNGRKGRGRGRGRDRAEAQERGPEAPDSIDGLFSQLPGR